MSTSENKFIFDKYIENLLIEDKQFNNENFSLDFIILGKKFNMLDCDFHIFIEGNLLITTEYDFQGKLRTAEVDRVDDFRIEEIDNTEDSSNTFTVFRNDSELKEQDPELYKKIYEHAIEKIENDWRRWD